MPFFSCGRQTETSGRSVTEVISLAFLQAYDATQLVKSYSGARLDILIDQGKDDQFLSAGQLLPDNFIAACTERKIPVVFRLQQASCFCTPWLSDSL